jgi:POT family proton-dependent oligopeptide transporter
VIRKLSASAGSTGGEFFGHPRGLAILFTTETWERFSYFGNAALVVLYMIKYLLQPGRVETVLGFGSVRATLEFLFGPLGVQPLASQIFGFYTGLAYCAPILGGLMADRLLGERRTVLVGGVLMAIGHFMMAFEALFLLALLFLALGIGAFKPNISSQVGALYAPGDHRRDRGYSIFYVGINIGAFLAPLVCGSLAVAYGWHFGFAAAGIGMLVSLAIYVAGSRVLPSDPVQPRSARQGAVIALNSAERRSMRLIMLVCATVTLFWAAYDQQGNTIMLWAEDLTDRDVDLRVWRGEVPSPWFLALNPLFIFLLTPLIVSVWARQGARASPIHKMAFGAACLAVANLIMAAAASTSAGKASSLWLVGYFSVATLGELHLAPVGLAFISKTAPAKALSMSMGLWFAATLPADILGGFLGGYWTRITHTSFFLLMAGIAALASTAFWLQGSAGFSASRDRGE